MKKYSCGAPVQLYYTKSSPYANSVRMVISEIGIEKSVELIETFPFDNSSEFVNLNPLGKIPCLVHNGEVILDSEVICDYLDAITTGGELFNSVYADWRLKTLYSLCSGLQDSSMSRRMETLREKEGSKSAFWWERHSNAIIRTLQEIENKLPLWPEDFCILHINLLSALTYLDFRHSDINWREKHPALLAFYEKHETRPCIQNNPLSD